MQHLCVTLFFAISSERIEVVLLILPLLLLQCRHDRYLDIASCSSSYLRTMHLHCVYDDVHDAISEVEVLTLIIKGNTVPKFRTEVS